MAEKKRFTRRNELRAMNDTELRNALESARRAIYKIRRERLSKPQEDVKATHAHRKEIAQILTLLRERQIEAQKAGAVNG
jgi:ribosomal protein L29